MPSHPYEDEDQAGRLAAVFGANEAPPVDGAALTAYAVYLNALLHLPCPVVAMESFDWEEPFLTPDGDANAYESLRTDNPAHTDDFDLVAVEEIPDADDGLMARIRRQGDDRLFTVPLENLEARASDSEAFVLLKDYVVWHILQG